MPLDQLPGHVLVQILQCLPFKDRVRVARVNRQFMVFSEVAISRTKTFHLTAPVLRRIPLESMAKLIDLCSGSLQKVSFNNLDRWYTAKGYIEFNDSSVVRERVGVLLRFTLPRLSTLKLVTVHDDPALFGLLRQLLIKNPSVRTLEWNYPPVYFINSNLVEPLKLACKNLERVEFHNCEAGNQLLPFFLNNCPNLKHLELRLIADDADGLRRLDSLKSLILGSWHFSDEIPRKISIFFPQLELLELSTKSDGITSRGLEHLEKLKNLREFKIVYCYNDNLDADANASAMELTRCKCLNIVQFRRYFDRLNPSTVQAFTRHCPQLRQLIVLDIRGIDSPNSARRFVLSLDGFVQQKLSIKINGGRSKVWKCSKVKSALAKINKSGKRLSIEIASDNDSKVENKWGEFGDSLPIRKQKRWYRKVISWIRRLFRMR